MMSKLKVRICHRNWDETFSRIFTLLTYVDPADVVYITGPSQAGKSRMVSELRHLLDGDVSTRDKGVMNTVHVTAHNASTNGAFSTKLFAWDLLQSIKHPFYSALKNSEKERSLFERTSEGMLYKAFTRALIDRKVKYLFIDEAQHVKYSAKSGTSLAIMDSWKSMAINSKVVLVIVGAYPILGIIRNSPHLIGRTYKVSLARYFGTDEDLLEFAAILREFQKSVPPGLIDESFMNYTAEFQQYSFGCIGILWRWVVRIIVEATIERSSLEDLLNRTRLSDDDLISIGEEIREGEEMLSNVDFQVLNRSKLVSSIKVKSVKKVKSKPFKAAPRRYKLDDRDGGR
jgi:hypothetical protein